MITPMSWIGIVRKQQQKESNYIIKEVSLGKLVVKETEDEIVVTTTGGIFTYDGQPHGATVEVSEPQKDIH